MGSVGGTPTTGAEVAGRTGGVGLGLLCGGRGTDGLSGAGGTQSSSKMLPARTTPDSIATKVNGTSIDHAAALAYRGDLEVTRLNMAIAIVGPMGWASC